ncbi:hypothetical protein COPCOM_03732 [Coprococcus comes ATCC 27758]|uniref:Uncharacterized protein n=1 Tax=Coprococcus comes ATCC 27758 TaxID=470146 RepID=C0BEX0_9FIRM|nr:hypothetical protein COPCOM_03732 [Coprococcus comes ATCC 27758]
MEAAEKISVGVIKEKTKSKAVKKRSRRYAGFHQRKSLLRSW